MLCLSNLEVAGGVGRGAGKRRGVSWQQSSNDNFTHWEMNGQHLGSLSGSLEQQKITEWIKQELCSQFWPLGWGGRLLYGEGRKKKKEHMQSFCHF